MTINVSSIKIARTFASLALTTIGIVAVGTFWSYERGRRHIEIVKNRSREDLEIIKKSSELADEVTKLKKAEATKDVPVSIPVSEVENAVGDISQRAKRMVEAIEESGEYISDYDLKDAFEGIQDTDEPIKKLISSKRAEAVIESRSEEEVKLIKDAEEMKKATQRIFAKEDALLPDLETSIMSFASRHKKVPRIVIQGLFILPVIPIIDLLLSYVSMVVHAVNIGHSADMVTTF